MNIFYQNELVGTVENPINDMWYIEGVWSPAQSEAGNSFNALFRLQDMKSNFSELKGVLIGWSENDSLFDGLAFGILESVFVFRMLNQGSKELLLKEGKLINL